MPASVEAFGIFLLLSPGFVALKVMEICLPRKNRTPFESFLTAFSLSLISYAVYAPFTLANPVFRVLPAYASSGAISISIESLALLIGIGVLVGFAASRSAVSVRLFQWMRSHGWTNKTGRGSVWEDAFAEGGQGAFCVITLANGKKISGWVRYYSEDPDRPEILVTPHPGWKDSQGIPRVSIGGSAPEPIDEYPCEGVLLTDRAGIEEIDFISGVPIDWGHEQRAKAKRTAGGEGCAE